jgi:SAM-dependent methyltransferase
MRPSIKQFVRVCSKAVPIQEPIFEFGAMQVPGQEGISDLRPIFPNKRYIGSDISHGPGVDIILDLHDINLSSNSVGTVITCDTFEHVKYPYRAISELYRIIKPGGILIITSVMDWPIHGYPNDYWRFTPEGFRSLLSDFPSVYVDSNGREDKPHTVIGIASKGRYDFSMMHSMRDEWKTTNDFPLSGKLLSPVVKCKKFVERITNLSY